MIKVDEAIKWQVSQFTLIDSKILRSVIHWIEGVKDIEIRKENLLEIYSCADLLDIKIPLSIEHKLSSLADCCIEYAAESLNLLDFTDQFCQMPYFAALARVMPQAFYQRMIRELFEHVDIETYVVNFRNICPYIHEVAYCTSSEYSEYPYFPAKICKDLQTFIEYLECFKTDLLHIKLLKYVIGKTPDAREMDLAYMSKLPFDMKVYVHAYVNDRHQIEQIFALPNLSHAIIGRSSPDPIAFTLSTSKQKKLLHLETLLIGNIEIEPETLKVIEESCPHLRELTLWDVNINQLPIGFANLELLCIQGNQSLTAIGLAPAATYPCLRQLAINRCARVMTLPAGFSCLEKLDLLFSGISDEEIHIIGKKYILDTVLPTNKG